jgi:hypothetical protein
MTSLYGGSSHSCALLYQSPALLGIALCTGINVVQFSTENFPDFFFKKKELEKKFGTVWCFAFVPLYKCKVWEWLGI